MGACSGSVNLLVELAGWLLLAVFSDLCEPSAVLRWLDTVSVKSRCWRCHPSSTVTDESYKGEGIDVLAAQAGVLCRGREQQKEATMPTVDATLPRGLSGGETTGCRWSLVAGRRSLVACLFENQHSLPADMSELRFD